MTQEELKQYYIDSWRQRKASGMSHTGKEWDERAIGWVKELEEDPLRKARSNKRIAATAAFLKQHGLLTADQSIIDIGCGPGQFVAAFAETAKHVTGTDISGKMCQFGLEYAHSKNRQNVDFVVCDFKNADLKEMGWEARFDLVFSSITPAMSNYESFRKAEQMSRAWCFQSNFIRVSDPLGDDVLKEIFDDSALMHKRGMKGLQAMFAILTLEGCMPVVEYYKEESREILPVDDHLVNSILKEVIAEKAQKEAAKGRLKEALLARADADGCVKREVEWIYSWVLWDVRQKKGQS